MRRVSKIVLIVMLGLSLFAANSVFAIEDGEFFSKLPNPRPASGYNIRTFANATVGLQYYNKQEAMFKNCTGIRISQDTILTAAHCVYGQSGEIDVTTYDSAGGEVSSVLSRNDFITTIPSIYMSFEEDADSPECLSSDVALIKISHIPKALDNDNFINIRTPSQIIKTVEKLNSYMFDPDTRLYAFGWGSNEHFEFATKLTQSSYDSNTYNYYKQTNIVDSWSYMHSTMDEYTMPKFDIDNTLNQQHNKYQFLIYPPYWELAEEDSPDIFTNPNILFISTIEDNNGDYIGVEDGDSGGPLLACDGNSNNCALIGILESRNLLSDGLHIFNIYVSMANKIVENFLYE